MGNQTQVQKDVISFQEKITKVKDEIGKVIVGNEETIIGCLAALVCQGHVLLEGVPGLGKTKLVRSIAKALNVSFSRIQFTPDLLPADLIGTQIYSTQEGRFSVKKGPLFAHVILADEINRAPAKVQSALLEAMQEKQVTIGDETFSLPEPFLVMATQNPVEQEGTYPLPEAQVDRFMLKVRIDYPNKEEEIQIMKRMSTPSSFPQVSKVLTPEKILALRSLVDQVFVDEKTPELELND